MGIVGEVASIWSRTLFVEGEVLAKNRSNKRISYRALTSRTVVSRILTPTLVAWHQTNLNTTAAIQTRNPTANVVRAPLKHEMRFKI
jgi:hypothetical protein